MAVASDDDVQDGDTTAAGIAPAASAADEEDRTVQQAPDEKHQRAVQKALGEQARPPPPRPAQVVVPTAKPGAAPVNVTSKRMTVVGLAPPAAASAPGASTSTPMTGRGSSTRDPAPTTAPAPAASAGFKKNRAPMPVVSSEALRPSARTPPSATEAEEEDASITATAPAPRVPPGTKSPIMPPLTVPGAVQIREMPPPNVAAIVAVEDEPLDETEVRTVVSVPSDNVPASKAKVGAPASSNAEDEEEELEDSVTTQAPSAVQGGRLPEEDEPKTSPPLRLPAPIPAAGRSPFDEPPIRSAPAAAAAEEDDDAYNVEDSVTTRGPAIPDFHLDENSVTADSPVTEPPPESSGRWPAPVQPVQRGAKPMPLPIEDGTEGTTNRFPKRPAPRPAAGGSPAALASTMQSPQAAPGLRVVGPSALASPPVIASPLVPDDDAEDEDDDADNGTAVMLGAPVKPIPGPGAARQVMVSGSGGAASRAPATALSPGVRDPSSDSGLRIASHEQQQQQLQQPPPGERANLGAMMSGALAQQHGVATDRGSGVSQREYPSQPIVPLSPQMHYPQSEPSMALGATIPASAQMMAAVHGHAPQPQMQQYDFASSIKKPRYGLLVGLVALLSFAIPLVLFLALHQSSMEQFQRTPAEVASQKVPLDPHKNTRFNPAASASASHGKPNGKPPGRR